MRHLIDTYVQAEEPRKISPFDDIGLLDLIVKTGIADAIAQQLGAMRGDRGAVAETIENNVRRTIVKEQLNDPAYFERMSKLLDEIIEARKAKALEYEEYLKQIHDLVKKVKTGHSETVPQELNTPGKRAIFNNLRPVRDGHVGGPRPEYGDADVKLAIRIDETVRRVRPDGWRGHQAREQVIKAALYGILQDQAEVERLFLIIKAQKEY